MKEKRYAFSLSGRVKEIFTSPIRTIARNPYRALEPDFNAAIFDYGKSIDAV